MDDLGRLERVYRVLKRHGYQPDTHPVMDDVLAVMDTLRGWKTPEPDPYLVRETKAHRLPFGWWLCRDTGTPRHYPPRAWEEMVRLRLLVHDENG